MPQPICYPPVLLHASKSLSLSATTTHITKLLSLAETSAHLHPDALLTPSGPEYSARGGLTGGLVLHQLRRVEAGLRGEHLLPEEDEDAEWNEQDAVEPGWDGAGAYRDEEEDPSRPGTPGHSLQRGEERRDGEWSEYADGAATEEDSLRVDDEKRRVSGETDDEENASEKQTTPVDEAPISSPPVQKVPSRKLQTASESPAKPSPKRRKTTDANNHNRKTSKYPATNGVSSHTGRVHKKSLASQRHQTEPDAADGLLITEVGPRSNVVGELDAVPEVRSTAPPAREDKGQAPDMEATTQKRPKTEAEKSARKRAKKERDKARKREIEVGRRNA